MTQLSREYVSRHFFGPTILDMRLRVTLVEIANRTVDIPDPENIRATFRISLITCLQAELCIFPVLEPPYWISEWTPHKWTRPDKWTPHKWTRTSEPPDKWEDTKLSLPAGLDAGCTDAWTQFTSAPSRACSENSEFKQYWNTFCCNKRNPLTLLIN